MSPSVLDMRTRKMPATSIITMMKMAITEAIPRSSVHWRHDPRISGPPSGIPEPHVGGQGVSLSRLARHVLASRDCDDDPPHGSALHRAGEGRDTGHSLAVERIGARRRTWDRRVGGAEVGEAQRRDALGHQVGLGSAGTRVRPRGTDGALTRHNPEPLRQKVKALLAPVPSRSPATERADWVAA